MEFWLSKVCGLVAIVGLRATYGRRNADAKVATNRKSTRESLLLAFASVAFGAQLLWTLLPFFYRRIAHRARTKRTIPGVF